MYMDIKDNKLLASGFVVSLIDFPIAIYYFLLRKITAFTALDHSEAPFYLCILILIFLLDLTQ